MFSTEPRCQLQKHQLSEVICQLRFPEILMINSKAPAEFQERIRDEFPQYSARKEATAPKIVGTPGNFSLENPPAGMNYQFASADGVWRINLTGTFISLACKQYTSWESFAQKLDKPLAAFIQVYKPAYFERIGLRYLNFFSRKQLQLESTPFSSLIQDPYLGVLADPEVPETTVGRNGLDVEVGIRGGCKLKLHTGPGIVKQNGQTDKEIKFIFDQDLFMPGKIPVNYSAGALETLHSQAWSIFRGAITDTLLDAMEPTSL